MKNSIVGSQTHRNGPLAGLARFSVLPTSILLPIGIALILCIALALSVGVKPTEMALAIWDGAWGNAQAAAVTIGKTTPLLLTGLAVSLAYNANLLNIGCEGQLTLGAITAAVFGAAAPALPWPLPTLLPVCFGAVAGAAWAFPAIWLRRHRGVSEVISTLLMNYVAIYLADYLVLGPLGDGSSMGRTAPIVADATWGYIWGAGSRGLTPAPIVALSLALLAQLWLSRTYWGYEVQAVGANAAAAKIAGIAVDTLQVRVFVLSGALAGLAGALEVAAVHHRFYRAFSPGYGFDGITVAFLVGGAPAWLWVSALLLASLRASDKMLQLELGMSPNAILVIQSTLLLAAACRLPWGDMLRYLTPRIPNHRGSKSDRSGGAGPGSQPADPAEVQ